MEILETEEYKGYTIQISIDDDPENPRTVWDNLVIIARDVNRLCKTLC
jgi:hypothetical protein